MNNDVAAAAAADDDDDASEADGDDHEDGDYDHDGDRGGDDDAYDDDDVSFLVCLLQWQDLHNGGAPRRPWSVLQSTGTALQVRSRLAGFFTCRLER